MINESYFVNRTKRNHNFHVQENLCFRRLWVTLFLIPSLLASFKREGEKERDPPEIEEQRSVFLGIRQK